MQTPQDSLKLCNLELQIPSHAGVEVVCVDTATVPDAVAEPGIEQLDSELLQQQHDVVIYRWNAGGHGNVEGDRAAVGLRHVGGHRISSDPVPGLEELEIESVRVVIQRPGRPKTGNAAANDGDAARSGGSPAGCHGLRDAPLVRQGPPGRRSRPCRHPLRPSSAAAEGGRNPREAPGR